MTPTEIRTSFLREYLADDGGVRLDPLPADDAPPLGSQTKRRVINDNGLLYHAEWIAALVDKRQLLPSDVAVFRAAVTDHRAAPGTYQRHPGNTVSPDSHDNLVGIAGGSRLVGNIHECHEICRVMSLRGWAMTNYPLQGGDIAFLKLTADWVPTVWEQAWLCLGLLFSILFGKGHSKVLSNFRVSVLLQILRDKELVLKYQGARYAEFPRWLMLSLVATLFLYGIIAWIRYDGRQFIPGRVYFRADHPIVLMNEVDL